MGGTQDDGDTVTLSSGDDVTCTITNDDDPPSLTLVKEVEGGTATPADFTLTAAGPTDISGPGPSVSSDLTFKAGTYDLSESSLADYTGGDWTCEGGGNQTDGDTVEIGLGEHVTCTIVNSYTPPSSCPCGCVENDGNNIPFGGSFFHGISIRIKNFGCIFNTTSASSNSGGNTAGGSHGGNGGAGGDIEGDEGNNDNGGASAGHGGSGGRAGAGGLIVTGNADSTATTTNDANTTRVRFSSGGRDGS